LEHSENKRPPEVGGQGPVISKMPQPEGVLRSIKNQQFLPFIKKIIVIPNEYQPGNS
jgi:hypothetical protein